MDTIKNYIMYFKDVTFDESPFNDVDNVIFSSLIYINFDNLIDKPLTLKELGKKFFNVIDYKEIKKEPVVVRRTIDNFELLFNGHRYKDIVISDYQKIIDDEKQFCAMKLKSKYFTYIVYQGTDDSVIGWKEDFQMIYKFPVPSQQMAIDYINRVIKFSDRNIIVGGHSKGGNLAMTAGMCCKKSIKRRIKTVYNNDGPGFRLRQINSHDYKEMLPKLKTFVPEESVVGLMLRHTKNIKVIKSSGRGIFQHNLNNWKCYGPILIEGKLSKNSEELDKKVLSWLNRHDDDKRKKLVDTLFDTLNSCDITLISQLRQFKLSRVLRIIKLSKDIDKESKDLVLSALKVIVFKDEGEL